MSGDAITAEMLGTDALARAIEEQIRAIPQSVRLALVIEAAAIAGDAASRVPVQTGALRDSVRVRPTERGAAVGFAAPYAAEVHERTDVEHANGEAKFLENAVNAAAGGIPGRVASRVKIGG